MLSLIASTRRLSAGNHRDPAINCPYALMALQGKTSIGTSSEAREEHFN